MEIPGPNIDQETGYSDVLQPVPHFPQTSAGKMSQFNLWPIYSTMFPRNCIRIYVFCFQINHSVCKQNLSLLSKISCNLHPMIKAEEQYISNIFHTVTAHFYSRKRNSLMKMIYVLHQVAMAKIRIPKENSTRISFSLWNSRKIRFHWDLLLYHAWSWWGTYRGCCSRRDGARNSD